MNARLNGFPQDRHYSEVFAQQTDHLRLQLLASIFDQRYYTKDQTIGQGRFWEMLALRNVTKDFGGLRAVDGVSFHRARGTISGLIGPNGAGKSTLFNVLAGAIRPSGGEVVFDGERIDQLPNYRISSKGLMRTFQIPVRSAA